MRINRFTVHRDSQRVHSVIGVPRTLNECLVRVEHLLSPIFIPPTSSSHHFHHLRRRRRRHHRHDDDDAV